MSEILVVPRFYVNVIPASTHVCLLQYCHHDFTINSGIPFPFYSDPLKVDSMQLCKHNFAWHLQTIKTQQLKNSDSL